MRRTKTGKGVEGLFLTATFEGLVKRENFPESRDQEGNFYSFFERKLPEVDVLKCVRRRKSGGYWPGGISYASKGTEIELYTINVPGKLHPPPYSGGRGWGGYEGTWAGTGGWGSLNKYNERKKAVRYLEKGRQVLRRLVFGGLWVFSFL